jgi:hypothetical protein
MIDLQEYDLIQIYLFFIRKVFNCDVSLDLFLGMLYLTCHQLYIICNGLIICFTTNINHLFIMLLILWINVCAILICKTCPLYLMEQKYINTSYVISSMKIIGIPFSPVNNKKNNKQKYFTKHLDYCIDELSLQMVFSCYILIVLKIMLLIIL